MALVAVATTTSGARPYQPLPTTGRLATMKVTIYGWRTSQGYSRRISFSEISPSITNGITDGG
jgi:hypothetical protein